MTTFNFTTGNPANLTGGAAASMTDIGGSLTDIKTFLNGGNLSDTNIASNGVDNDNLDATTVAAKLGLSQTGSVRRGKSIIATEESRTNTSYGLMTTPDRVSSVVLPTDGLICVLYHAMFKNSVTNAGRAGLFIGANQAKQAQHGTSAPVVVEDDGLTAVDTYQTLLTNGAGQSALFSATDGVAYGGDVTTGQVIGTKGVSSGVPLCIFADAGTYDISIQFKSASGSVTVKQRRLYVWTMGF